MKAVVHPVTAETHLPGEEISEPAVLVWIGDIILQRARTLSLAAARASGLTYDHQDGDPA